jgi:NAD-dependent dihydropyrimidine dehydrogenase PreA subunit
MIREIVHIDEEKCDGCGVCVPACHEGAIRIINGKARVVAENLCDGLGACLGHCPQGAIRIEKREAEDFDERAVEEHLGRQTAPAPTTLEHAMPIAIAATPAHAHAGGGPPSPAITPGAGSRQTTHTGGGCPSQRFARLGAPATAPSSVPADSGRSASSELAQWPVQLRLLPARAPMLHRSRLLLAADCVPFALADFHSTMLRGHALAIACPKLDDTSTYLAKLTEMIAANEMTSITVAHMEVPCCMGILLMAIEARRQSGVDVPIEEVVVSTQGEVLRRRFIPARE